MTETQEKLVLENQKLIGLVINKNHLKYRFDELVDGGMIGLIKGAKNFDNEKGFKASTYLYYCIQIEIYNYLRASNSKKRGRDCKTISLDQEVFIGNKNIYVSDLIVDEKVNVEEELEKKELINKVHEKINELKEKDKNIICHNFGILGFKKLTQCEIADRFKISQSQVSKIVIKTLKKIRKELKDYV